MVAEEEDTVRDSIRLKYESIIYKNQEDIKEMKQICMIPRLHSKYVAAVKQRNYLIQNNQDVPPHLDIEIYKYNPESNFKAFCRTISEKAFSDKQVKIKNLARLPTVLPPKSKAALGTISGLKKSS